MEHDGQTDTAMQRGEPENLDEARKAKVSSLQNMVKEDAKHWNYAFKRMNDWRDFARGLQWPGDKKEQLSDPERRYVTNITMRHLKQRTASIYAKNPTYEWRRNHRMTARFWDGTASQLNTALLKLEKNLDETGMSAAIIQDAIQSRSKSEVFDKIGQTLTAVYTYFVREQIPPTKKMMKKQVLVTLTCGVAYFKQTFHRATDFPADVSRQLADGMAQLQKMERLAADLQDGEINPDEKEMEDLRLVVKQLESSEKIVLREGLALAYPDSTNIIPDRNMTYLPGFIGCGHVTEQYVLTVDQIKEVYGIDITPGFTSYVENEINPGENKSDSNKRTTARVWEIWDQTDRLVYTICDGYKDYLVEPHEPITYTERFFPWFAYAPNAVDDPEDPFPPSDVELIQPMQAELNRAGEALRQHRFAARPGHVTGSNVPEADRIKIQSRRAHEVLVLNGLKPDERIEDKFQPFPASPIDPNLYHTGPAFTDILRSVGTQEANLGGTSGATATETQIAQDARMSTLASAIDEFDDLLTEMARAGGQILLAEMSHEKIIEIVGEGAVWPEMSREEISAEIYLEVTAGSSGRRNQAQEVMIRERVLPLLFQLPGLKMEQMAKDLLHIMDDSIIYEDWVDMDALPVMAMNGQIQGEANRGTGQSGGGANAPQSQAPASTGLPRPGQNINGPSPQPPTQ